MGQREVLTFLSANKYARVEETANIRVDGAAKLQASKLNTLTCTIEVDGASKAELGTITKELSASAEGASRLEYHGTPAIKKQDVSGAAKIQSH